MSHSGLNAFCLISVPSVPQFHVCALDKCSSRLCRGFVSVPHGLGGWVDMSIVDCRVCSVTDASCSTCWMASGRSAVSVTSISSHVPEIKLSCLFAPTPLWVCTLQPTDICCSLTVIGVLAQGQSSTSCSAFRRRRQARPRNKPRAPEWRIVYIHEQVCITCDGWNMKVLVFWLCNWFTV